VSYPCRCNRRACQKRRNLKMRPEDYTAWPKCHACGDGLMYVDEYRLRKGPKDNAPRCTDIACTYADEHLRRTGRLVPYHRVSNAGCIGNEDYKIECAVKASKHRPIVDDSLVGDCPF